VTGDALAVVLCALLTLALALRLARLILTRWYPERLLLRRMNAEIAAGVIPDPGTEADLLTCGFAPDAAGRWRLERPSGRATS
jgi:hypothetical protein